MQYYDAIIIGADVEGWMCAIEADKRGHRVIVLEYNARVGEKILISGSWRCNFTNLNASSANYISQNQPRKSVLSLLRGLLFTENSKLATDNSLLLNYIAVAIQEM